MSPRPDAISIQQHSRPDSGIAKARRGVGAVLLFGLTMTGAFARELGAQTYPEMPIDLAFARGVLQQPVLTNDGARVAFVVRRPPAESPRASRFMPNGVPVSVLGSRVFVTEVATGSSREVGPDTGNCWRPSWSPDGNLLALYCDTDGQPHLWIHDVTAQSSRRLTDAPMKAKLWEGDGPLWGPDGQTIYVPLAPPEADEPVVAHEEPSEASLAPRVTVYRSDGGLPPEDREERDLESWIAHYMRENNAAIASVDLVSGAVRALAPADASPPPSVLRVSPSGRWVAYLSVFHKPRALDTGSFHDLAVVPATGGTVQVLASDIAVQEGNYYLGTYLWHPIDDRIVWVKDERLWTSDLVSRSTTPRPLAPALTDVTPAPLGFTADGTTLVVSTQSRALALVPMDGGEPRVVPYPEGLDLQGLVKRDGISAWQPVPNTLTLVFRESATAHNVAMRLDLASGTLNALWKGSAAVGIAGAPADHGWLAVRIEDTNDPGNLYRLDADFGNRRQLTDVEPSLAAVRFGPVEAFETRVPLHDGRLATVTTAVLLPPGRAKGDRLPALVFIYPGSRLSGRASGYGGGMVSTVPVSAFTTRGYAVLLADLPIGPDGQAGQPMAEMVDLLLPQIFRAAELGYIDLDRVAVSGQSYGGYGTASMLAGTNLFRAGIAIAGLYDLSGRHSWMDERGMAGSARWSETGQGRMGTHPWGDLRRYIENSPYYQADRIHTPLLLLHGDSDTTCPVEDAGKMFNALRRFGRTAELAVYEGEGHTITGWSLVNAVDAVTRMLSFLEEHVRGGSKDPEGSRR